MQNDKQHIDPNAYLNPVRNAPISPKWGLPVLIIVVGIIVIGSWHGASTTPPPYHLGAKFGIDDPDGEPSCLAFSDSNWTFQETYFVKVPCEKLPKNASKNTNRESGLFIGVFNGNRPITGGSFTVSAGGISRKSPYELQYRDYNIRNGADWTAEIKVTYEEKNLNPSNQLNLVFMVLDHTSIQHEGKTPWWGRNAANSRGGCGNGSNNNLLSYYRCLDESNSHAAEHVFISEMVPCESMGVKQ